VAVELDELSGVAASVTVSNTVDASAVSVTVTGYHGESKRDANMAKKCPRRL
jgi:hypothetical protein